VAKARKEEAVTVSFHYLSRKQEDGEKCISVGFSRADFDSLVSAIWSKRKINLNDENEKNRLRFRQEVPLEQIEIINKNTVFGVFKASYWGHSYENTDRGKIPADSISLRPFHFLIYYSESGKIYIASQYLGTFGGYSGLQQTLKDLLPNPDTVIPHSFRSDGAYFRDLKPQEVRVNISTKSRSISGTNSINENSIITFKKQRGNEQFGAQVKKRLLRFTSGSQNVKSAITSVLNENSLMDVRDSDIEECKVIGTINGRRSTVHLIDKGSFATRYPLNVKLTHDGHPEYAQTRDQIMNLLQREIISRREDV